MTRRDPWNPYAIPVDGRLIDACMFSCSSAVDFWGCAFDCERAARRNRRRRRFLGAVLITVVVLVWLVIL